MSFANYQPRGTLERAAFDAAQEAHARREATALAREQESSDATSRPRPGGARSTDAQESDT